MQNPNAGIARPHQSTVWPHSHASSSYTLIDQSETSVSKKVTLSTPPSEKDLVRHLLPGLSDPWRKALLVPASFIPYMNSWGLVNSFGVYQAYYSERATPLASETAISWIGSIQAFLLLFVGVLVGPCIDKGYVRWVVIAGGLFSGLGMILVGSSHSNYAQLIILQGFITGIGSGMSFLPSISMIPQWYSPKSRGMVLGLVASGSGFGGLIYAIMFHYIERSAGFGWAARAIGLVILGTTAFSALTIEYHDLPTTTRSLVDLAILREADFLICCLAWCLEFIGLYVPIFFIQSFAATQGITTSTLLFWLVPIVMAGSIPGRILPNILAVSVGNLNVTILVTISTGVLALSWIAVSSVGGIIAFGIIYGFMSGAYVSLLPPLIVTLAPSMKNIATRMGTVLTLCSFGVLIGNPVAAAILSHTGSYLGMQLFAGVLFLVSAAILLWVRFVRVGLNMAKI